MLWVNKNMHRNVYFLLHTHVIFQVYPQDGMKALRSFNIFLMIVEMSYHTFNNLE